MSDPSAASTVSDPRSAFDLAPGTIYMDGATYGLPPRETIEAMQEGLAAWSTGSADWIEDWDRPTEEARSGFARLAGVADRTVALLPALSIGVGLVAASLEPGDEVVVPADEFTSVLYPFLVAKERGVRVREVGIGELADAVGPGTTIVATSLVQMQTGLRADLEAIREATENVGARILLDATQALPFLRPGEDLARVDYVIAHGYKHLLCPRGAAFMAVREDRLDGLDPVAANWRSADDPYGRYFGGPLALGEGARKFDVSLAWLSWIGARISLRLLGEWRDAGAFEEVWTRVGALAAGARMAAPDATIVCVPVRHPSGAREALADAGIKASVRGESVRLGVHLWTSDADVERTLEVLAPYLPR